MIRPTEAFDLGDLRRARLERLLCGLRSARAGYVTDWSVSRHRHQDGEHYVLRVHGNVSAAGALKAAVGPLERFDIEGDQTRLVLPFRSSRRLLDALRRASG